MAGKKPTKKRRASLDIILSTVERGFAKLEGKMDRGFAAVAEDIADISKTMTTKDDVRAIVREELKPIRSDLKSIRDELDDLTEKLENVSGFRSTWLGSDDLKALMEKNGVVGSPNVRFAAAA
jgi:septation ring formation regulator EzrA